MQVSSETNLFAIRCFQGSQVPRTLQVLFSQQDSSAQTFSSPAPKFSQDLVLVSLMILKPPEGEVTPAGDSHKLNGVS